MDRNTVSRASGQRDRAIAEVVTALDEVGRALELLAEAARNGGSELALARVDRSLVALTGRIGDALSADPDDAG